MDIHYVWEHVYGLLIRAVQFDDDQTVDQPANQATGTPKTEWAASLRLGETQSKLELKFNNSRTANGLNQI